jgi:hypothetical protein
MLIWLPSQHSFPNTELKTPKRQRTTSNKFCVCVGITINVNTGTTVRKHSNFGCRNIKNIICCKYVQLISALDRRSILVRCKTFVLTHTLKNSVVIHKLIKLNWCYLIQINLLVINKKTKGFTDCSSVQHAHSHKINWRYCLRINTRNLKISELLQCIYYLHINNSALARIMLVSCDIKPRTWFICHACPA